MSLANFSSQDAQSHSLPIRPCQHLHLVGMRFSVGLFGAGLFGISLIRDSQSDELANSISEGMGKLGLQVPIGVEFTQVGARRRANRQSDADCCPPSKRRIIRGMEASATTYDGPLETDRSAQIQCVKVTRPDTHGGQYCVFPLAGFSAADEFDGAEIGESITLTLCAMTEAEFDALPEFNGW